MFLKNGQKERVWRGNLRGRKVKEMWKEKVEESLIKEERIRGTPKEERVGAKERNDLKRPRGERVGERVEWKEKPPTSPQTRKNEVVEEQKVLNIHYG